MNTPNASTPETANIDIELVSINLRSRLSFLQAITETMSSSDTHHHLTSEAVRGLGLILSDLVKDSETVIGVLANIHPPIGANHE